MFKKIEHGDLSEWPLDRYAARLVRVRLVRGPQQIIDKFRELRVRAWVVRRLAHIYIERHIADLGSRPGVLKIHTCMKQNTVEASLKEHVNKRVSLCYPESEYGEDGQILPEIKAMALEQQERVDAKDSASAFDMKQTAMPEPPTNGALLFEPVGCPLPGG